MRFVNPSTSEELHIDYTIELGQMLASAAPNECFHANTEVRARTIQGGSTQVKKQCLDCGVTVGNPLPKAQYPNASSFDEFLLKTRQDERDVFRWTVAQNYVAKQQQGELSFRREYEAYISSPAWKKLRSHVFKRCAEICEGCMENGATEVHHLSYRHFGAEFLFELAGLCHDCHSRFHQNSGVGDSDSRPCRGCRFQGDGVTCPLFEISEIDALADSQYCGPELSAFQALK